MEFTLLDNGQDSLKKAKYNIEKYEELVREHGYPYLKDAVIFLNHGIEMLLKFMLTERNESLIFSDIKVYLTAKKHLKNMPTRQHGFGFHIEKEQTVFDVPNDKLNNKKLTTITLLEAVERIEYLCDIEITEEFRNSIFVINNYRNDLTHHTINLSTDEEDRLLTMLKTLFDNVLEFFEKHIPGTMETIDAERFEVTNEEWEEMQQEMADFHHEQAMSKLSIDPDEY